MSDPEDGTPRTYDDLKETVRYLSGQQQVSSIFTDTVRGILDSGTSFSDIIAAVLESSITITGSGGGVLILNDKNGDRIVDSRGFPGSSGYQIKQILKIVDRDIELGAKCRRGSISGAYYLNSAVGGEKAVQNLLCVPARDEDRIQGFIVLYDTPGNFEPRDLENIEKMSELLSLALARQKANDELEMAKEKAEREAAAKSRFLAAVSHEIRSPLNGVLLMSSILQGTELTEEQKELVSVVMFSANTIDRLIRDLTDLTQISTGKLTILSEDFNLEELCRNVVETNRPAALRKGLRLEYSVDRDSVYFVGDRERFGQIIGNLLSNAIKYTDRGRVNLAVTNDATTLRITVSDTGTGISTELQESVFGLFNQGKRTGQKRGEGVGIGLTIVRELSELMGGRVFLKSEPERGSIFTVELPVKNDGPVAKEPPLPETAYVLVVEDEGVNRLYIRTLLEREGWVIDEAVNGIEAVALTRNNHYDLVLMDISMPEMGGLEASAMIREKNPVLPIIAITANAYVEDRRHILAAGVNDIVLKPVDAIALSRSMKRCLRR